MHKSILTEVKVNSKHIKTHQVLGSRLPGTRPEFLDFSENRQGKEQVVFSGEGRRVPKMSLALGQPQGCTGATLACSRASDIFGSLRPSPQNITCSFPYRFWEKSRKSGLVPGNQDPKPSKSGELIASGSKSFPALKCQRSLPFCFHMF